MKIKYLKNSDHSSFIQTSKKFPSNLSQIFFVVIYRYAYKKYIYNRI